ncbi:MAG: UDP-N-acetylmuramate dehydrogenase [Clostridia bacterium]|nr:UDP-N-acetylmuramate dehydrogenase [Clostridia bacterium]
MKNVKSELIRYGIVFDENYKTASRTSFRIGGEAALAVFPSSEKQLITAVALLDQADIPFETVGKCSNVLFAFDRFEGALVFTDGVEGMTFEDNQVDCSCGASLTALAARSAELGLGGLEFAYGIPGTVGGAVFMNAGAYGSSIDRVLTESRAYDRIRKATVVILDHGFGYRSSLYMKQRNLICLGARFTLQADDPKAIRERMHANMEARREKQPLSMPNAGSYFKRPEGYFAGKLIEDAGLKGTRVGDAQVSSKHAGFLVNCGHATAEDVLTLEALVVQTVQEQFGVCLEREVRVIRSPKLFGKDGE